jgi:hypothetical protein
MRNCGGGGWVRRLRSGFGLKAVATFIFFNSHLAAGSQLRIYELEANEVPKHTMSFVPTSCASTRKAIINDLLGNLNAANEIEEMLRIVSSPVSLEKLPRAVITAARTKSITENLRHIPEEYKDYYPKAEGVAEQQGDADQGPQADAPEPAAKRQKKKPGPKPNNVFNPGLQTLTKWFAKK